MASSGTSQPAPTPPRPMARDEFQNRFRNIMIMIEKVLATAGDTLHQTTQLAAWGLDPLVFGPSQDTALALSLNVNKLLLLLWSIKDYLINEMNKLNVQLDMRDKIDVLRELYHTLDSRHYKFDTVQIPYGNGQFRTKQQPRIEQAFLNSMIQRKRRRLDDVRQIVLGELAADDIQPLPALRTAEDLPAPSTPVDPVDPLRLNLVSSTVLEQAIEPSLQQTTMTTESTEPRQDQELQSEASLDPNRVNNSEGQSTGDGSIPTDVTMDMSYISST